MERGRVAVVGIGLLGIRIAGKTAVLILGGGREEGVKLFSMPEIPGGEGWGPRRLGVYVCVCTTQSSPLVHN